MDTLLNFLFRMARYYVTSADRKSQDMCECHVCSFLRELEQRWAAQRGVMP